MSCDVNPELVSRLADGELPRDEEREIRAHVEGCSECRDLHDRLVRLAALYRAAHRPAPVSSGFAERTMRKLATIRGGRARPPRRRRLIRLGAGGAALAAAALLLIVALGPSDPVGSAEGLVLKYDSGWVWAGMSASIQERCPYAIPSAPARIRLGSVRVWLDRGTIVTVENVAPASIHLLGGSIRVMNPSHESVRVRTPAVSVVAPPGSEFTVRCPLPDDPEAIQTLLRDSSRPASSVGALLLPAARAAPATDDLRPVVIECLAGRLTLSGGSTLPMGQKRVHLGAHGPVLQAPCDPDEIRRTMTGVAISRIAELDLEGLGRAALDIAEEALDDVDGEVREEVERLLVTMAPVLTRSEFERIETWLASEDDLRVALGARMAARRGRVTDTMRRRLHEILSLDSEKAHLKRAAAVAVLASTDAVTSHETLRTITANTEPPDLRLLAAWGLLASRDPAGRDALEEILGTGDEALAGAAVRSVRLNSDVMAAEDWRGLLRSPHPSVRAASAFQLGFLGTPDDLPALEAMVSDASESEDVRRDAISAITRLSGPGDHRRLAALARQLDPVVARTLVLALASYARDPEVVTTVRELSRWDPVIRASVLTLLARHDAGARDALVREFARAPVDSLVPTARALSATEPERLRELCRSGLEREEAGSPRWVALVECVAFQEPHRAATILRAVLAKSPPAETRARCLTLLASLGIRSDLGPAAARDLIAGIPGSGKDLRGLICTALGATGSHEEVVPALCARLRNDPSSSVRVAAARSLGRRPSEPTVTTLSEATLDPDRDLAVAALISLATLGRFPDRAQVLLEADDATIRLWAATARACAGTTPDRMPLARAFAEADAGTLRDYLAAIENVAIRNEGLIPTLRDRCLDHPSPRIRLHAARFAPRDGGDREPAIRARFARDTHWFVRVAGAAYGGGSRRSIALALENAPGALSNVLRRDLARHAPIRGWYPARLTAVREPGDEQVDAEASSRVIQTLLRAVDEGGAEIVGDDAVRNLGRGAGLIRSLKLSGSLVPSASDSVVREFYRRFAESLR